MKTALSLLALLATVSFGHAGGFGGPPPFTNGSPLVTGVDGSYQATARGSNLTGIFRFTYSDGNQSTGTTTITNGVLRDPYNDYVFFVEGLVYRGLVQVNINNNLVAGVLDNGGSNVTNSSPTTGTFLNIFTFMSGSFTGKLQQQSVFGAFQGKGLVQLFNYTAAPTIISPSTVVPFTFKGVRNSYPTSS